MNMLPQIITAFKTWNVQLLVTIIGLLLFPVGYVITLFDLYMQIIVSLKTTLRLYTPMDIPTLIAEFFIISMAATLTLFLFKICKINCEATLDKAKEIMEELDMKIEANEMTTRFVDKTLALTEETCNTYNKLLHMVKTNNTKDVDILDLTRPAMREHSAECLKIKIQKSRDLSEKNISNLNFAENELEA